MSRLIIIVILAILFIHVVGFAQNSGFGLGIIIGDPTGITGKYWISGRSAIDGAIAWSMQGENLHLHGDYLLHKFDLIKVQKGSLPLYYGIGARFKLGDHDSHDDHNSHHPHDDHDSRHHHDDLFGIRIPVGLDYLFGSDPLDIFLELVPILDLVPDTEVNFNAAIGFRYFFK